MTYGKWKALHPSTKVEKAPVPPEKACEICGKEIPIRKGGAGGQRKYTCSAECEYQRTRKRARENYHKKKGMLAPEKVEMVCEICGKVIDKDFRSPYACSAECCYERHKRKQRERGRLKAQEKKARKAYGKI